LGRLLLVFVVMVAVMAAPAFAVASQNSNVRTEVISTAATQNGREAGDFESDYAQLFGSVFAQLVKREAQFR
jgi:hypothetical protein